MQNAQWENLGYFLRVFDFSVTQISILVYEALRLLQESKSLEIFRLKKTKAISKYDALINQSVLKKEDFFEKQILKEFKLTNIGFRLENDIPYDYFHTNNSITSVKLNLV